MLSGLMSRVKKVGAQMGVVKTGEEDESAKLRVAGLQKAVANLKAALARYYKAFNDRAAATAAVHDGMGELYPAGQGFSANLEALLSRGALFKDTKDSLDGMKAEIEHALAALDTKLGTLHKMLQDRAAVRIDIDTFQKDIAKYEADPKAGPKLDAAKAKLAEAQEKFNTIESVVHPEMDGLDKEIASLTTGAFQSFIGAQVRYNQAVLDAYYAGLHAVPAAPAPEGEAAPAGEAAGEGAAPAAEGEAAPAAPAAEEAAAPPAAAEGEAAPAAEVASAPEGSA